MAQTAPLSPAESLHASLEALHDASFGWARSCCDGDPDDAADVLQSSYVKVLGGEATFAGRSSFKTWLFGVIRYTALEHRRRCGRELLFQDLETEGLSPSSEHDLLKEEQSASLRSALARLPARQQEVLHLVFHQDMSLAEAAVVMGVSIGSARVHYDRGKRRLRSLLGNDTSDREEGAT